MDLVDHLLFFITKTSTQYVCFIRLTRTMLLSMMLSTTNLLHPPTLVLGQQMAEGPPIDQFPHIGRGPDFA